MVNQEQELGGVNISWPAFGAQVVMEGNALRCHEERKENSFKELSLSKLLDLLSEKEVFLY